MTGPRATISIEVVSDIVCPWCYIGKHRMEKAMMLASDRFDFSVSYFPFELNPHVPAEGVDFKTHLSRKFGSAERYHQLTEHIRLTAAREELVFNLHLQTVYPNTRNIHRIIMLARDEGKQAGIVELFFRAYFTEGLDLSQKANLLHIAAAVEMDVDRVDQLLDSNTGLLEIEMAEKELQDLGITSVPLFIIENRIGISGARPVEAFIKAFEEVAMVSGGVL